MQKVSLTEDNVHRTNSMSRIFRTDDLDYASVEYGRRIALVMVNGVIRACLKCNMLQNAMTCQDKLKSLTGKRFILVV